MSQRTPPNRKGMTTHKDPKQVENRTPDESSDRRRIWDDDSYDTEDEDDEDYDEDDEEED